MAELDRILGEAQETHRQMQEAVKTSGDRAVRDIVRLRTRFATLVAEMMGSIKADSRLQAKPDVAREFEAKFFDMRQALAQHQHRRGSGRLPPLDRRAGPQAGRLLHLGEEHAVGAVTGLATLAPPLHRRRR